MENVSTPASAPPIPDHEVLRVIGRGAYGEIWLARSLTGALRAVKVVYRSTFENERAFNREFTGMSAFEPISRAHDGFVDILHVGRNDPAGFFYYVMELADDERTGQQVDLDRYAPKTLGSELATRGHLPVRECVRLGLSMSAALRALHEHGLAHRDVKPSNIIFVNGVPKLADIGLVATSGQRSYVGTEGYVPPEGPGTAQADVFSLGKVLYEISMGKDRLDFPEVGTRLDEREDKAELLQLNDVLLKACATEMGRRYQSAGELHDDLLRLEKGEPVRRRGGLLFAMVPVAALIAGLAAWGYRHVLKPVEPPPPARVQVAVTTVPPGAMVILGDRMKNSPATFEDVEPGKYPLRVMLAGFDPVETKVEISASGPKGLPAFTLHRSTGSLQITTQPDGADYELRGSDGKIRTGRAPAMIRDLPTGVYELAATLGKRVVKEPVDVARGEVAIKTLEFSSGRVAVSSEPAGVEIFVDGAPSGKSPLDLELPVGAHRVVAKYDGWPEQEQSVVVEKSLPVSAMFDFGNGSVKITSSPAGATVLRDGVELGTTPLLIDDVKPGDVTYELRLAGCKTALLKGAVQPKKQTFLGARLEKRLSPEPGAPWENSLGMKFMPVGGVRFCIWETRVKDWAVFCKSTGRAIEKPDFEQDENHPVVKVNRQDAMEFCRWLTEKERRENVLDEGLVYRLPTDKEWSMAAGLPDEAGATPEQRDGKIKGEFPWGREWPPPPGAGNYADQSVKRQRGRIIEGYTDGFPTTAPVGSFKPNRHGLYDIGGNVWQWCLEDYKGSGTSRDWGVLRGGSWGTSNRNELLSSYRNVVDRNDRDVIYGFRCVLAAETPQ